MTMEERINFLLKEYAHFVKNPERFLNIIAKFKNYLNKDKFDRLITTYEQRHWEEFVRILLREHYDPSYLKSINKNFVKSDWKIKLKKILKISKDSLHFSQQLIEVDTQQKYAKFFLKIKLTKI